MKKRNTFTVTQIQVVQTEENKSHSTSESEDDHADEPPSMKMIRAQDSRQTKSSNSKEENYFESTIKLFWL